MLGGPEKHMPATFLAQKESPSSAANAQRKRVDVNDSLAIEEIDEVQARFDECTVAARSRQPYTCLARSQISFLTIFGSTCVSSRTISRPLSLILFVRSVLGLTAFAIICTNFAPAYSISSGL